MFRRIALGAALAALIAGPALSQNADTGRPAQIRGTVAALDGGKLTIKTRGGTDTTVALTDKTRISTLVRKSLADIKPGDFLASTGVKGADGKLHAIEVRILPRPAPDGGRQFPWDLAPNSVMTNAAVGSVTKISQGEVVHVTYKGGQTQYSVGPDVPVLASVPGNRSMLRPGAAVFVMAPKAPDGTLTAAFMYVETNGIKPAM